MTSIMRQTARKYLLWCANEHIEFRIPELVSIASMFKIPVKWIDKPKEDPYVIVEMKNENDARKLMSRTMLVRSCYELWGQGCSEEELHSNVKLMPHELLKPHVSHDKTFKVRVETFNRSLKNSEKLQRIESLSYLPFEGKVDLTNPDTSLHMIEYYGLHPNETPETPFKIFLGRWIVDGQRDLIDKYSLKRRTYIGSTSMDAQLSFIMANLAEVEPRQIVVDPFVGTGSVLVAAAHFGAHVWGCDIDYLTLHARTKPTRHSQKKRAEGESILGNLKQYGLESQFLDVAVMDNSNPFWKRIPFVDAIITDPPYGIRESTERVGSHKCPKPNGEGTKDCPSGSVHFPSKVNYSLSEVFKDLIDFAASCLVTGGRLVFWLPVSREDYMDNLVPSHPCLELVSNCEQILNVHSSRRLITLKKTREPQLGEEATAHVADMSSNFREKFFQASQMTKEEKALLKSKFPRDKRGQGLGYRLQNTTGKSKELNFVSTSENTNKRKISD
ncbi:tRNA (guanine(10)-N2)-methyltransferase homolog isoform X2 [Macrobrachium nipponense]|uniref:tRNA (guanine(10)-N2)-methyltransferase homolog isoform X2 n=1 Tax=Macrobrachium nipponense TaxID=159736 RepID=UPI0030C8AB1B